jgi:hypothetical protein
LLVVRAQMTQEFAVLPWTHLSQLFKKNKNKNF